jgi:hypothetical protein
MAEPKRDALPTASGSSRRDQVLSFVCLQLMSVDGREHQRHIPHIPQASTSEPDEADADVSALTFAPMPEKVSADAGGRHGSSLANEALILAGQGLLIASCLYWFLRGWARDFRVPLAFSTDGLLALMQSKSTIDNGWWWFNPMLGAPFGLDARAYPANSNVDQAVVWAVSTLAEPAGLAINVAWLVLVVLSGLSANWCMRKLGISIVAALVGGTLFALSPFAMYRNLEHFWLVIYLVPFVCTAALLLASGLPERWYWGSSYSVLLGGCVLIGFNYVYYAFFGCFVLAVGALTGFLQYRRASLLAAGGLCIGLIATCTALNAAPSLYAWQQNGVPVIIREKVPAEAEVYGLKIRQLVSPLYQHRFAPFRAWNNKETTANFPLETENTVARLGLVATLGFLALLAVLFVPRLVSSYEGARTLFAASQLSLAAVLLGTIGGFGSIFNLLVSPEIRAYNRITAFILFFSVTAVAMLLDSLFKTRPWRLVAAGLILAVGVADQRMGAVSLNAARRRTAPEISAVAAFVTRLESRLPDGAMVLQLPFRTFLNDSGVHRMGSNDHLRLYVLSHSLRWSHPALSNEQMRWQQELTRLDRERLAPQLAAEGFSAVVIDRYGYEDNGAAIAGAIQAPLPADAVIALNDRYIAIDIRALAEGAKSIPVLRGRPLSPLSLSLGRCDRDLLTYIEQIGPVRSVYGGAPIVVRGDHSLRVAGWAVDPHARTPAAGVDVAIDGGVFPTFYGADRPDVVGALGERGYYASGFVTEIPATVLPRGEHALSLRVVSSDRTCYFTAPEIRVVVD